MHNSGEFVSQSFNDFLRKYTIARKILTPYMPQSSGIVEQANWTILEMTWSLIHVQHLGHEFVAEAMYMCS